ncbi:unnamed protein product [Brassicogethes aeneus]|uniref:Lysosomal dipeptide transporter MFSD1 n=1 Tax=Brassicogethes aeneus TaxID=1431903 RepID=A0A9P0B9H8_BRAAE|nr:unnamed protein product [Brassicogethes aeneus]
MEGGPNIQDVAEQSEETHEEVPRGCCNFFCHPLRGAHRFIVLIFLCFLGFGSYFCYDNPAALKTNMMKDLNLNDIQYGLLYSLYSWPNVFMCFIGGYLIDRVFGIRLGTNIFMGLTFLGQIIFAGATYMNIFWLMLVGRFIFGIGAESLAVGQNNYAVQWFKGKELNMVFGLQLSFARIGSTVNFKVMDGIYNWVNEKYTGPQGMGIVLFIATSTCVLSMVCSLVVGVFDKRAEKILNRDASRGGEVVRLTDVFTFKPAFWFVCVICVAYYVAIFPFISFVQDFFMSKFHLTKDEANSVASIVYLISGFASPVLGFCIDKTGRNIIFIVTAICATIVAHSLIAWSTFNPYYGMCLMGIAYSALASSLWPLVSLIIPEYQLGTAYGVCQAIQNLGLAVMSIVAGAIIHNYDFERLEFFFIGCLLVALLATMALFTYDIVTKGVLNMTPKQRQRLLDTNVPEIVNGAGASDSTENLVDDKEYHVRHSNPPTRGD